MVFPDLHRVGRSAGRSNPATRPPAAMYLFPDEVDAHVTVPAAIAEANGWWADVNGGGGCPHFLRNVTDDRLILATPDHETHLPGFAGVLDVVRHPLPMERVLEAVNTSKQMVCTVPTAHPCRKFYRLAAAETLHNHCTTAAWKRSRASARTGPRHPLYTYLRRRPTRYTWAIDLDKFLRGPLPNCFWAEATAVERFGLKRPVRELLNFLGIEATHDDWFLFVMDDATVKKPYPRFVPTGWDAYGNEHFQLQNVNPGDPLPPCGITLNLYDRSTSGAPEFVTAPVRIGDVPAGRTYP